MRKLNNRLDWNLLLFVGVLEVLALIIFIVNYLLNGGVVLEASVGPVLVALFAPMLFTHMLNTVKIEGTLIYIRKTFLHKYVVCSINENMLSIGHIFFFQSTVSPDRFHAVDTTVLSDNSLMLLYNVLEDFKTVNT